MFVFVLKMYVVEQIELFLNCVANNMGSHACPPRSLQGLEALQSVASGGVSIRLNPSLCYVDLFRFDRVIAGAVGPACGCWLFLPAAVRVCA